jgi:hypothetical protein
MIVEGHVRELAIGGGLLIGLLVAVEVGYRIGRRRAAADGDGVPSGGQVGAIQGAMLGLLGLLLGFSFAGAASRFIDRQDLIVQEANAIGTAYLRADVIPEPHASELRQGLADYVAHRLEASKHLAKGLPPHFEAEVAAFHSRLWRAAKDGVLARPEMAVAVLDPVNDVIDLHSTRMAAGRKHLPKVVLGLLIACSLLSMGVIGFGCGMGGGRWPWLNGALAILIAAALWTTIDLDHPRGGMIRLSDVPLQQLDLRPQAPTTQK